MKGNDETNKRQQAINLQALRWALEREGMTIAEKTVLVSFAEHADRRGYSWPSVDRIAFTWSIDRRTVRRAIRSLLVRHALRPTKKRYGMTGQVKVYRLPKITYESGGNMHRFENDRRGHKAGYKRTTSGGEMTPNNNNKEQSNTNDKRARRAPKETTSSSLLNLKDAERHPHWRKFKAFCKAKDGLPTLKGFNTWLRSQPPPPMHNFGNGTNPRYEALLRESQARTDREHGLIG